MLDVVAELDLREFYASYRADGRGGAVYDPALMFDVLFYAYAVGEHSSRRIEARLVEDVAFRVVAANQQPDHTTLARFRARHQDAIAELFGQVLGLCLAEGLVAAGTVAIDGTITLGQPTANSGSSTAASISERSEPSNAVRCNSVVIAANGLGPWPCYAVRSWASTASLTICSGRTPRAVARRPSYGSRCRPEARRA